MKLSVIIPAYNSEMFLAETLDCLKKQTLKDIQIIIVNDGSTDKTAEIISEYAKNGVRVYWQIFSALCVKKRIIKLWNNNNLTQNSQNTQNNLYIYILDVVKIDEMRRICRRLRHDG